VSCRIVFLFIVSLRQISTTHYRVAQKTGTLCSARLNFVNYRPIFKLISLSDLTEYHTGNVSSKQC